MSRHPKTNNSWQLLPPMALKGREERVGCGNPVKAEAVGQTEELWSPGNAATPKPGLPEGALGREDLSLLPSDHLKVPPIG